MPDPAVEAARRGLPYVEPTGRGIKKAQVSTRLIFDPNNPTAPPRRQRVYEPKKGFWGRLFEKDVDWTGTQSFGKVSTMSAGGAPGSGHSAAMFGQGAGAGGMTGHSAGMFGGDMPMSGGLGGMGMPSNPIEMSTHGMGMGGHSTGMGLGGHSMGMGMGMGAGMGMGDFGYGMESYGQSAQQPAQQGGWPNMAAQDLGLPPPPGMGMPPEAVAALPKYERKQLKRMQAAYDKMVKDHVKAQRKREKQAMKEQQKMYMQALRGGLARPMPIPTPAMAEKSPAMASQPPPDLGPIYTWDPVPTLDQFGVRRPWNGLAEEAPSVSRTMTLACADMNRDEMNQRWLDKRQWVSPFGRTW